MNVDDIDSLDMFIYQYAWKEMRRGYDKKVGCGCLHTCRPKAEKMYEHTFPNMSEVIPYSSLPKALFYNGFEYFKEHYLGPILEYESGPEDNENIYIFQTR